MGTAPYGVRLLVGAATMAVEETMKLPQTILMYPMTLASQAAHMVMRWQQNLAELAIKGDSTLETLFPPKDEQPEWATFDEDLDGYDGVSGHDGPDGATEVISTIADGERRTEGRFALYSLPDAAANETANDTTPKPAAVVPGAVTDLGYDGLTLAQLRARLTSLSLDDLHTLLAYEEATKARAPFQTLLANRITRATAK